MRSLDLDEKSHAATPGVKPTERDDFAVKSDDPEKFQIHDYSDPDAVIASICLSEPCEVIKGTQTQNVWVSHGENQVWSMPYPPKGVNWKLLARFQMDLKLVYSLRCV